MHERERRGDHAIGRRIIGQLQQNLIVAGGWTEGDGLQRREAAANKVDLRQLNGKAAREGFDGQIDHVIARE